MDELSDEDINLLISLGVVPDKTRSLDSQLAMAQQMRQQALQGPEMRGNGRVMTAANPLEFLGKNLQARQYGKEAQDILGQQGVLQNQQTAARMAFLKALRGSKPPVMEEPNLDPSQFKEPTF